MLSFKTWAWFAFTISAADFSFFMSVMVFSFKVERRAEQASDTTVDKFFGFGSLGMSCFFWVDGRIAQLRMKIATARRSKVEHVPHRIKRVVVAIFLTGLGRYV